MSTIKVFSRLIKLVYPMLGYMLLAIIMGVIGFLCAIFIPTFGALGALNVLGYSTILNLHTIVVCLFVFALVRGILRYAEQACNHYIAFKLLARIRDIVFGVLRKLTPAKLEGKDKGNLIVLITSDVELLEVFYAHTISPICIACIVSLICVGIQFHNDIYLGLFSIFAYLLVGVGIPLYFSGQSSQIGIQYREEAAKLNSYVLESMRGLKESLQFESQKNRLNGLSEQTQLLSTKEKTLKELQARVVSCTNLCVVLLSLGILCIGIYRNFDLDVILFSSVLQISSFGPVIALANLGTTLSQTIGAGQRILALIDEKPMVQEVNDGVDVDIKDVTIENIDFSYAQEKILNDFSLDISNHKVLGIQGKSGSGKSTLLKLLMRFFDVDTGKIKFSGKNIQTINTYSLRENQGYVSQETILFHDTIESNLRIAKIDATTDQIVDACKKANIHEYIESLPKGYQTTIGELGSTLSGGEKQRLGLARMFLHDSNFVLLDEPTSNLDSLNEGLVLKSIYEEKENKTIVFVSHSKSALNRCDEVVHMESGRLS